MDKTLNRLKESQFFLQKLKENKIKQPDFNYYLNAFIGSARSIFWVMQSEYQDVTGWKQWYDSKQFVPEEDKFVRQVTVMRNESLKQGLSDTKIKVKINKMPDKLEDYLEISFAWLEKQKRGTKSDITEQQSASPYKIEGMYFEHDKFPGTDIINVCEKYLLLLQEKVLQCTELFGLESSVLSYLRNNPDQCLALTGEENFRNVCPSCYKLVVRQLAERWTRNTPDQFKVLIMPGDSASI